MPRRAGTNSLVPGVDADRGALTCVTRRELQASMTQRSQLTTSVAKRSGYIERRESGLAGAFTAKTREEADRVLEETIAKIAAKQAIERAKAKPES